MATFDESIIDSFVRAFSRLALKDKPFKSLNPVSDDSIDILKNHLRDKFPSLNVNKLQKKETSKCEDFQNWLEKHSRTRQYTFQIRKCRDNNCCRSSTLSDELTWLPDPVLTEDGDHFKSYTEVKGTDTTEDDRPSLSSKVKKSKEPPPKKSRQETILDEQNIESDNEIEDLVLSAPNFAESTMCTGQNAQAVATCTECRKPRVVYSKSGLSEPHKIILATLLSEYVYTCEAPLTPPDSILFSRVMTKMNLQCGVGVEMAYYSTGSNIGRKDICCHCGIEEGKVLIELKSQYKTVLPICEGYKCKGLALVVGRPYGNKKNRFTIYLFFEIIFIIFPGIFFLLIYQSVSIPIITLSFY